MAILYLIPAAISDINLDETIPPANKEVIKPLRYFIVENVRTARRFISSLNVNVTIDDLTFFELSKHTSPNEIPGYLKPLKEGHDVGLISEAGLPGVADPGSDIVHLAHEQNVSVKPLTGPSSIFLALMASGMNGQNFAFNGYLPIQKNKRIQAIQKLEKRSRAERQTQIFMEAPYRNMPLLNDVIKACHARSRLCIAANITSTSEFIKTKTVQQWSKGFPDLHKRPCIFILQG